MEILTIPSSYTRTHLHILSVGIHFDGGVVSAFIFPFGHYVLLTLINRRVIANWHPWYERNSWMLFRNLLNIDEVPVLSSIFLPRVWLLCTWIDSRMYL